MFRARPVCVEQYLADCALRREETRFHVLFANGHDLVNNPPFPPARRYGYPLRRYEYRDLVNCLLVVQTRRTAAVAAATRRWFEHASAMRWPQ